MTKRTIVVRDGHQRFTSTMGKPWQSVVNGVRAYHGTRAKALAKIEKAGSGRVFFMYRPGVGILADHLISADADPKWKALVAESPPPAITIEEGA